MRYLLLTYFIIVLSSCSLWPWRSEKTGTCLDDGSCQNEDPLAQELRGGTWYCYGSDRDQPWDCSQNLNDQKIVSIPTEQPLQQQSRKQPNERIAMQINEEQTDTIKLGNQSPNNEQQSTTDLSSFPDDSYAVQLTALQSRGAVEDFINKHNIKDPQIATIRSQGNDWYVVLLGIYDDINEAKAIASEWQATKNPSSEPWVRTLGPLKRAATPK